MKQKKSFLAGLVTVLLLAAVGYVIYRYRAQIAEKLEPVLARLRRGCSCCCDPSEYDDFADV